MELGPPGSVRRSFHDPEGAVYEDGERLLRRVSTPAAERIERLLQSALGQALSAEGLIPSTRRTSDAPEVGDAVWLDHQRIDFPSYPHEWVPEMLADAGLFTLRLARRLLADGWMLKDASARNVLFDGVRPVFVDLCSVIEWDAQPVWLARDQLERHFTLPVLAYRHTRQPPHALHMMQPDGLSHTALYEAVGRRSWLMPSLLWSCAVPATLGRHSARQAQSASGAASAHAKDVLDWSLRGSERRLEKARRSLPAPQSSWSGYWAARDHYSAADQQTKAQIVADFLALARPMSVLDIGANTGEYSRLAGRLGARVVAIECDLAAQRLSYAAAREEKVDVLPLLVDFANPTPALGWNGRECLSFDQRAAGRFDCVLALAVVHHLLVSRGIPLDEIVKKLAAYSRKQLIIEYVSPSDPMFRKLSGRRGLDFSWLTPEAFMSLLGRHFRVVRRECVVSGVRELLLCEKH